MRKTVINSIEKIVVPTTLVKLRSIIKAVHF